MYVRRVAQFVTNHLCFGTKALKPPMCIIVYGITVFRAALLWLHRVGRPQYSRSNVYRHPAQHILRYSAPRHLNRIDPLYQPSTTRLGRPRSYRGTHAHRRRASHALRRS